VSRLGPRALVLPSLATDLAPVLLRVVTRLHAAGARVVLYAGGPPRAPVALGPRPPSIGGSSNGDIHDNAISDGGESDGYDCDGDGDDAGDDALGEMLDYVVLGKPEPPTSAARFPLLLATEAMLAILRAADPALGAEIVVVPGDAVEAMVRDFEPATDVCLLHGGPGLHWAPVRHASLWEDTRGLFNKSTQSDVCLRIFSPATLCCALSNLPSITDEEQDWNLDGRPSPVPRTGVGALLWLLTHDPAAHKVLRENWILRERLFGRINQVTDIPGGLARFDQPQSGGIIPAFRQYVGQCQQNFDWEVAVLRQAMDYYIAQFGGPVLPEDSAEHAQPVWPTGLVDALRQGGGTLKLLGVWRDRTLVLPAVYEYLPDELLPYGADLMRPLAGITCAMLGLSGEVKIEERRAGRLRRAPYDLDSVVVGRGLCCADFGLVLPEASDNDRNRQWARVVLGAAATPAQEAQVAAMPHAVAAVAYFVQRAVALRKPLPGPVVLALLCSVLWPPPRQSFSDMKIHGTAMTLFQHFLGIRACLDDVARLAGIAVPVPGGSICGPLFQELFLRFMALDFSGRGLPVWQQTVQDPQNKFLAHIITDIYGENHLEGVAEAARCAGLLQDVVGPDIIPLSACRKYGGELMRHVTPAMFVAPPQNLEELFAAYTDHYDEAESELL
jgi:hypothetical protein